MRRDPSVFLIEDLIVFFLNTNMLAQIDELVSRIVVEADLKSQTLDVCCGMLASYLDIAEFYGEGERYFSRFKDIVGTRILPQIRMQGTDLFLRDGNNRCDIYRSILAGRLLQRFGELDANATLKSVGMSLVISALSLSDELGFLPATLHFNADRVMMEGGGYLPPEDIYALISESRFLPDYKTLYPALDPGTWIWTAAELHDFSMSESALEFSFSFPRGNTHHLIIQGLEPFQSLVLKDIVWQGDPNYYRFHCGWFYDETSRTLLIKLRQDSDLEKVIVRY